MWVINTVAEKLCKLWLLYEQSNKLSIQISTNCVPNADRVRSGAQTLWYSSAFSGAHILLVKKKKSLDLQIYSGIGKTMRKLQWISKAKNATLA